MTKDKAYYEYALFRFENGVLEKVNEADYYVKFQCGQPTFISKITGQEENVVRALHQRNAAKRFMTKFRKAKMIA